MEEARSEAFVFEGAEGQTLSGRLDFPPSPRAWAVFAHCFTCSKTSLASARIARGLAARGIGVLRFDFTGLGESEGDFADTHFSYNIEDLRAAVLAMNAAKREPTLLVGHSLGGAAAIAAAGNLPAIRAVATIGAPSGVEHLRRHFVKVADQMEKFGEAEVRLAGRTFRVRQTFLDDIGEHDQESRIRALARPLLVLHSPRDEEVGIDNAGAIFAAARHPKSFVSLDDADHLLTRAGDADYAAGVIAAWADRYLD